MASGALSAPGCCCRRGGYPVLRRAWAAVLAIPFILAAPASGENTILTGGQQSRIDYRLTQRINPGRATGRLELSCVLPASFSSPTYQQRISDVALRATPSPDHRRQHTDRRGNQVVSLAWTGAPAPITVSLQFNSHCRVDLARLETTAPFPLPEPPDAIRPI